MAYRRVRVRVSVGLVAWLAVAACAPSATTAPKPTPDATAIAVPTQPSPQPGTSVACPPDYIQGRLSEDATIGVGLLMADGFVRKIVWPYGFFARRSIGGLQLIDATGNVVARTGDLMRILGQDSTNGAWLACGEIELVEG